MESQLVLLDTSVLIDYFRKKEKEKTFFITLTHKFDGFCIPSITEFEIYTGATDIQFSFWEEILKNIRVLPFDIRSARAAVSVVNSLRLKRKTIDKADLFIAAIAIANNLPIATLNIKHFDSVDNLVLVKHIN